MTNTLPRSLVSVFAALLGLAPATARADDWATTGLDGAHSRFSAERSGPRFGDGRWATTFRGAQILASPVVAEGVAVVVDLGGGIHALDATTGAILWEATAGSQVQGTPAIARGRLFVPTTGNHLLAFRLADGAPLWTRDVGGMVLSSPTPIDQDVVLAAGLPQRHLVRLSAATGEIVWQTADVMDEFSNTSPAVGGGLVIVGSNGGRYYAFDAATGSLRWTYAGTGIVHLAAPLIWNGHVYMAGGGDSSAVHGVDAATGAALPGWPIELPNYDPDVPGTLVGRQRAVSSPIAAGGLLLLETRQDDALDTDGDGAADQTLSRESVVGLDPGDGTRLWDHPLARVQFSDPNQVPKFFVCPTPAGYTGTDGSPLAAIASSLSPLLSVLDVASGTELVRHAAAGATLASPVVANGRLINAATNGVTEGLLSSVNHPPSAPVLAANPRPLDAADVRLRWLPGTDPDGELPGYELRIDADGEVLQSWQQQIVLSAGVTSTTIAGSLSPGVTYTVALRARDSQGAYSPWSAPETFQVIANPPVQLNGQSTSLAAALAAAAPGDELRLSAAVYTLTDTLRVGPGVSLRGAGPGRTLLDGTGLAVGISFDARSPEHPPRLEGMTIAGADTCVEIGSGVTDLTLRHVVVRDCRLDGVAVAAGATAVVVNATFVGDGNGVHSAGSVVVKNSLLTDEQVGLLADSGGQLTSTFNDLFNNQVDYQGTTAGTGDVSVPLSFADLDRRDLRLTTAAPTTDSGDPAAEADVQPAPDGGLIDVGAYAGTAGAKTGTVLPILIDGDQASPAPLATASAHQPLEEGGCSLGGQPAPSWLALLAASLCLVPLALRRTRRRRPR